MTVNWPSFYCISAFGFDHWSSYISNFFSTKKYFETHELPKTGVMLTFFGGRGAVSTRNVYLYLTCRQGLLASAFEEGLKSGQSGTDDKQPGKKLYFQNGSKSLTCVTCNHLLDKEYWGLIPYFLLALQTCGTRLLGWEFIKEKTKARKQENTHSFKKIWTCSRKKKASKKTMKKKKKVFSLFLRRFLGRERVFLSEFSFFWTSSFFFLNECVFSRTSAGFLVFLLSSFLLLIPSTGLLL